jgi:LysM repeat protein
MYTAPISGTSASAAPWDNREVRPARAVHLVKPGEDLNSIARQYGTSHHALISLNNHQLGSNGHGLQPGMRLEI